MEGTTATDVSIGQADKSNTVFTATLISNCRNTLESFMPNDAHAACCMEFGKQVSFFYTSM